MNISKKYLEVLQLSFEAKHLGEDGRKLSNIGMQPEQREKIKVIEERMDVLYENVIDVSTNPKFNDIVALAAAYHNIGLEYVYSTEIDDLNTAVICFSRCLELLRGKQSDPKAILTSIGALNELNLVCDKVEKKKYTYKFLNTAMELYLKYTMEDNFPEPVHIARLVDIKEEKGSNPKLILDNLHYTTLQDLGIQYLAKPKDKHGFVLYMHKILKTRLTDMITQGVQFDDKCLDWALTLFDLSRYFLANDRFTEARNHIAAADYVIYRFTEDKLKPMEKKGKKARFNHLYESCDYVCAISARSWGSYGVALLRYWMGKFLQNKENKSEVQDLMSKLEIKEEKDLNLLIFSDLEKELECMINQIKETCILNFAVAKSIFVETLRHLNTAKEYFTADTDIDSYAKIILQISEAYKYLAGFEEQSDKRIKLHKRRVECLDDVRKKFHREIDVDTELQTYKRIWYEIVTSCSTVMDLMLENTYYDESFKETSMEADRYAKLIAENVDFYLNIV